MQNWNVKHILLMLFAALVVAAPILEKLLVTGQPVTAVGVSSAVIAFAMTYLALMATSPKDTSAVIQWAAQQTHKPDPAIPSSAANNAKPEPEAKENPLPSKMNRVFVAFCFWLGLTAAVLFVFMLVTGCKAFAHDPAFANDAHDQVVCVQQEVNVGNTNVLRIAEDCFNSEVKIALDVVGWLLDLPAFLAQTPTDKIAALRASALGVAAQLHAKESNYLLIPQRTDAAAPAAAH